MRMIQIFDNEFVLKKKSLKTLKLRDEVIHKIEDPEKIINECRKLKLNIDLFTFTQDFPNLIPKYNYFKCWDNIAAIPVVSYDYWINYQVSKNTRKLMKKIEKNGLSVKVKTFDDELIRGIMDIFNETPIRRGRPYSYYGYSKEQIIEGWKPDLDRSDFVVAYFKDEIIGFIKLVYSEYIARASGTITKLAYRDYAPMSALLKKCFEICIEKKISYLMYGKYFYSKYDDDQLISFKQHNGFVRIDIPRYYIPLSVKGKIALVLKLHEGIRRFAPDKIIGFFVKLRNKMYLIYYKKKIK